MKVLWVSASPIGPAARILGQVYQGTSGGWIQTVYEEIKAQTDEISFSFICFDKNIPLGSVKHGETEEGEAYCLNMPNISFGRTAPKKLIAQANEIIQMIHPDVIQIWGTETCVQNLIAQCAQDIPKVVFLQGMIGIHDRYRGGNLKKIGYSYSMRPKEYLTDKYKALLFHRQVRCEKQELMLCKNVIIDGDFANAYCKSIHPDIDTYQYRLGANSVFVDHSWKLGDCQKHSIFTVFGGGPDKGLHQLLSAVKILKPIYPDIKVYIPGGYHIVNGKLDINARLTAYERFLHQLMSEYDILDQVVFCGKLSLSEMACHLENCHVFVNPSAMEVHAGSLREAMTVGVPSVSSFCGSVGEFLAENVSGFLYRYEEYEVLAQKIKRIFDDDCLAEKFSENAKKSMQLFQEEKARQSIIDIYETIVRQ